MRVTLEQIAAFTQGTWAVAPADAQTVSTDIAWDSRIVKPGDLYVALPGERVDGHDFIEKSLAAGAVAALITHEVDASVQDAARARGAALIQVVDAAQAITDLAAAWRPFLQGRVIGLSGSTGKTTTKNLVRDVLSTRMSVVATLANQNNELGVPRTVLAADPETDAVIVEMGMRGRGQLESLCAFVRPEWGVITNVGESHVELLGSRDEIGRAKAELLAALPDGTGRAFVNAGNDYSDFLQQEARLAERDVTCVLYDGTPAADLSAADGPRVWAEGVCLDGTGHPEFVLHMDGFDAKGPESLPCKLGLCGAHNVQNACAAAAVARSLGMSLADIVAALEVAQPETGRQEILAAPAGYTVINDAYNASPDSMRAALQTLRALQVAGRRIAVLGDMGEMGDFAPAAHNGVGRMVVENGVDRLVCVGPLSAHIAQGAKEAGMPADDIVEVLTVEDALATLETYMQKGDAILVKASHAMELERVAEGLVK